MSPTTHSGPGVAGPIEGDPATLWHAPHVWWVHPDGRSHPEPCGHPVVGGSPTFFRVAVACAGTPTSGFLGAEFAQVRRSMIAQHRWAKAKVLFQSRTGVRLIEVGFFAERDRATWEGMPLHERPVSEAPRRPSHEHVGWDNVGERAAREILNALRGAYVDPADLRALGLSAVPDAAGLLAAWRETAKRTHPDAGGDAARFVEARAAFERLREVIPQ